MERKAIILKEHNSFTNRVAINSKVFKPIKDDRLKGLGYTINILGEVKDKNGVILRRTYLPHLSSAIFSTPCNKTSTGRCFDTFFCDELVISTFYSD